MECQDMRLCGPAGRIPRVGPVSRVPRIGVALPCFVPGGMPVRTVNGRSPDSRGDVALGFSDFPPSEYAAMAEAIESATGRRLVVVDAEVDWTGASANPVRNGAVAAAIAARYSKPVGGIPASDLASGVTSLLNGALQMTPEALYALLAGKSDKSDTYTAAQADAAIAAAIAAVVNAAPAAFDTLKEIADWIGDDQSGAQALINQVSNKVDKVAGKGLSANDYTTDEKAKLDGVEAGAKDNVVEAASASAFPQTGVTGKIYVAKDENKTYRWDGTQYVQIGGGSSIDVVPPSTDPADAGKAADAKATGDALAGKLSKSEAEAGFTEWTLGGLPNGVTNVYSPEFLPADSTYFLQFSYNGYDYEGFAGAFSEDVATSLEFDCTDYGDQPHITVTATRTRLPTMADIPAKTSDLTNDSGFLTQHQQLTPIYGGNGQQYGDWVYSGIPQDATGIELPTMEPDGRWVAQFLYGGNTYFGAVYADENATRLDFEFESSTPDTPKFNVTATLAPNPVVGYTLGDQTTKPLQPQGDYAPATNIAKSALASDVQTSLGKADTAVQPSALAGAVRYDLPADATTISSASSEVVEGETITYGEATLADRTANRVAITAAIDELRLTFPDPVSGKVRDFGLRVEVGTGSAALTAPALVPPAGVTLENSDGAIPALADGTADAKGVTLLYFSETAPGVFLVKGEEAKEVA